MKAKLSTMWNKHSGRQYCCSRCGYRWKEKYPNGLRYCPNCYQKEIHILDASHYAKKFVKSAKKGSKKIHERIMALRERIYLFKMENQHLIDLSLFIIALVVILRVSIYFFVELGP